MTMPLQAKLLRVIQDGVVRRVGSEQQDAVVDVRFISATNREPQEAVDDRECSAATCSTGCGWCPIKLPPLRKRPGGHSAPGQPLPDLLLAAPSPDGRPGSPAERGEHRASCVRDPGGATFGSLQNVIEHVAVLAEPDQVIQPNDIPVYDDGAEWPAESAVRLPASWTRRTIRPRTGWWRSSRRSTLTRLVSRAGGNMSKAARLASIDRTTLYRLMDKHEFHRDDSPGSPA